MHWGVILFLLFFWLTLMIIFTKLTFIINFHYSQNDVDLKITVKLYRFISFTYNVPLIEIDEEEPGVVYKEEQQLGKKQRKKMSEKTKRVTFKEMVNRMKMLERFVKNVKGLHKIILRFLKKITIKKLEWKRSIGLRDAAHTGIVVGTIWSIKGSIIGTISHLMKMKKKPIIDITPLFQQQIQQTYLRCMFSFRIGYAILAALRVVKYWSFKGGKQHVRTSNSGLNDNGYGKFKAND